MCQGVAGNLDECNKRWWLAPFWGLSGMVCQTNCRAIRDNVFQGPIRGSLINGSLADRVECVKSSFHHWIHTPQIMENRARRRLHARANDRRDARSQEVRFDLTFFLQRLTGCIRTMRCKECCQSLSRSPRSLKQASVVRPTSIHYSDQW